MTRWTPQQVLGLAPDPASAKAGQSLGSAASLERARPCEERPSGGCARAAARSPTRRRSSSPSPRSSAAARRGSSRASTRSGCCSCGRRPTAVPAGERPAWVQEWLASREQRARACGAARAEQKDKRARRRGASQARRAPRGAGRRRGRGAAALAGRPGAARSRRGATRVVGVLGRARGADGRRAGVRARLPRAADRLARASAGATWSGARARGGRRCCSCCSRPTGALDDAP